MDLQSHDQAPPPSPRSVYITKAISIALFTTPAVDKGNLRALPSHTEALRRPLQLKGDLHAPDDSKGDPHALPTHTEAHLVKAIKVQVGGERRKVVMHTKLFLHRTTVPDSVSYTITHDFYTLGSS